MYPRSICLLLFCLICVLKPVTPLAWAQSSADARQLEALDAKILELFAVGNNKESLPLSRRVVELSDKILGPDHPKSVKRAEDLAHTLAILERREEAKPLYARVIKARERALSSRKNESEETLLEIERLGDLYQAAQRYADAERLFRRLLAAREKAGSMHPKVAKALDKLSLLYTLQERYAEQEPIFKRQIEIFEKTQNTARFSDPVLPKEFVISLAHNDTENAINSLINLYNSLGKYSEMEALAKKNIENIRKEGKSFNIMLSVNYMQLGQLAVIRRQYAKAEEYFKKARVIEQRHPNPQHKGQDSFLQYLADVYLRQRRFPEAEKAAEDALKANKGVYGDATLSPAYLTLARSYYAQKRYADAEKLYNKVEKNREKALGSEYATGDTELAELSGVKLAQGDALAGYEHAKRATSMLIHKISAYSDRLTMSAGGEMRPSAFYDEPVFDAHLRAAVELTARFPGRAQALAAESFEIAQWAQHSQAASALSQMAVRLALGDGPLAQKVRQRRELVEQRGAIDKKLTMALAKPDAQRSRSNEDNWRKTLEDIDQRLKAIDASLAQEFPQYAALVNPAPLSVKEVQELLRPGEALVQIAQETPDRSSLGEALGRASSQTYVWVITREDVRWKTAPIGAEALAAEVAALRCGLDESAWQSPERCRKLLGGKSPDAAGLPYDLVRAHALYVKLLQPFDDLIKDKRILLASSGALATLPLQALVTEAPDPSLTGAERYAKAAWLGRKQPLTVLPSITSLKSLRRLAKKSVATNPYAGFGNPLLLGADGKNRSAWARQSCQTPDAAGQRVAARSVVKKQTLDFFSGGGGNVAAIRAQEPLPETADELCQIADALSASPDSVFLGAAASERTLKSLSAGGKLKSWRVLHFATHGLVAGETKAFAVNHAEPALLLTPPETPTTEDDGLLTASEVARLEMDADWVILSACNTAAADGSPEAEALSGLASAFLYAGARSLLVSHWYVNSEAAVKLVGGAFAELRRTPTMGKSEALRRSIEARIEEGGYQAHPSYWAPFVIVGEGE